MAGTLRDKAMDNKLKYIPNNDKPNYPSCRLNNWLKIMETTSLEPTNHISIKVLSK